MWSTIPYPAFDYFASWPTHPDGSNKRMGEMTRDEQQAQRKASNARVMNPLPAALVGPDEC